MKHPHYEVMMEWAADTSKVVQYRTADHQPWEDCTSAPSWMRTSQYRIKPTPKPDVVKYASLSAAFGSFDKQQSSNLVLTFDGETGRLKKAEVLE